MNKGIKKVIVVGAGGHARPVVSILSKAEGVELVGIADRTLTTLGEKIGNVHVVTTFEELPNWQVKGIKWVALAIGGNQEREQMYSQLKKQGFSILNCFHKTANIEEDVEIGEGAVVCLGALVCAGVKLGKGVLINSGAIVEHEAQIEAFAHISSGSCLAGRVHIGKGTLIGAGSRIIEKIRIGKNCVIGAGSVVVHDIPDNSVAYGVPAKVSRHV